MTRWLFHIRAALSAVGWVCLQWAWLAAGIALHPVDTLGLAAGSLFWVLLLVFSGWRLLRVFGEAAGDLYRAGYAAGEKAAAKDVPPGHGLNHG